MARVFPIVAVVVGCSGGIASSGDRAGYLAAVSDRDPTEAVLDWCDALSDADLRGDCGLVVAIRLGRDAGEHGRYCGRVDGDIWQEECWFQAAEASRSAGRVDEAVAACTRAGRFRARCGFHLWQDEITRIDRSLDLAAATEAARAAHARWAHRADLLDAPVGDFPLGGGAQESGFDAAFWSRFYQHRFEPLEELDLGPCDGAGEQTASCVAGVLDVVRRRAVDQVRFGGQPCDDMPAGVEAGARWWGERSVYYVPDPRIDADLRRVCGEQAPQPRR